MHERFMRRALELARIAEGRTRPNPVVGAVIVRDGEIVGEGYHHFAGSAHAEVEAIQSAGSKAAGSTLYVTLEPCNHHGRTPPCSEAVIAAGIKRVVFALADPNPTVTGGGAERLRQAGLDVVAGVLVEEATYLNRFFLHHARTGRPWIVAKFASSLDGKIATTSGESKWITGTEARSRSHQLRSVVDAIIVGSGTVIADNPRLTARGMDGTEFDTPPRQPVRIVLDSRGRIPTDAHVFDPGLPGTTIAVSTGKLSPSRSAALLDRNVEILELPENQQGHVQLADLVRTLGDRGLQSAMVEGGSDVHGSFLADGLVDEVWAFLSPSLIGGAHAVTAVGGSGVQRLQDRFEMEYPEIERLGRDILIRGTRAGWNSGIHLSPILST